MSHSRQVDPLVSHMSRQCDWNFSLRCSWKRLSITKGRYSQIHDIANARNEFIHTSDTQSSHFADFFFEYFILRGIFFQNRGKKHTFWQGEWGRISAPKTAEKKHWIPTSNNIRDTLQTLRPEAWLWITQIWGRYSAPFPMPKSMFFHNFRWKIPNLTKPTWSPKTKH